MSHGTRIRHCRSSRWARPGRTLAFALGTLAILASPGVIPGAPAHAAESRIFLSGHLWEPGGISPALPFEELQAVGIVNEIRAPLFWSPSVSSYTWYVHGLVSMGSVLVGNTFLTEYLGGEISIHVDGLPSNASYGVWPANATAPSTFTDGAGVYLTGKFESCALTFHPHTASGSFVGEIVFTGGNAYPQLQSATAWTIGSSLAGVSPAGYAAQLNGTLFVEGPSGTAASSWADVKALYR
jgi:hypothetical protein